MRLHIHGALLYKKHLQNQKSWPFILLKICVCNNEYFKKGPAEMTFFPIYIYVCVCKCITKKERVLFFLVKVHSTTTVFSKLLLSAHSAWKSLSKLLYSYRCIFILDINLGYVFRDLYKCTYCECCSKHRGPGPEHCYCIWSANWLKRCLFSNHLFGILVGEYKDIWVRDGKGATVTSYWS